MSREGIDASEYQSRVRQASEQAASAKAQVEVVAIEDSIPGVTSAVASGAVTIGVPHILSLAETDATVLWPTLAGRTTDDIHLAFAAAHAARIA